MYVGDFYQLPPPDGVALVSIPVWLLDCAQKKDVSGRANSGLELIWGGAPWGVQSIIELKEAHRCKDLWYNDFVNEVRTMNLSEDNYNFVHGYETSVPGSWLAGRPCCGNKKCEQLPRTWAKEKKRKFHGRSVEVLNVSYVPKNVKVKYLWQKVPTGKQLRINAFVTRNFYVHVL